MKRTPDFTIVTASYNQGHYLEQAITSVLSQRNVSIEYIVLDGGSSDNSLEVINKYKDSIDYSISQADGGCANALNRGLGMASGRFFMYLNSDDYLIENSLEKVLAYLERANSADVYLGHGLQRDERKSIEYPSYSARFSLKSYLRGRASIIQQGTVFRTASVKERFRFNELNKTCWDGEFLVDLALKSLTFQRLPLSLKIGVFRLHEESISGSGSRQSLYYDDLERIRKKIVFERPELATTPTRGGFLLDCIVDPGLMLSRFVAKVTKTKRIVK